MLSSEVHQPLADERAAGYRDLLQHSVPHTCAAAVNDVVPWVLRRTLNERAQVREVVSAGRGGRGDVSRGMPWHGQVRAEVASHGALPARLTPPPLPFAVAPLPVLLKFWTAAAPEYGYLCCPVVLPLQVLAWMSDGVLGMLEERHLPQLEAALEGAMAAPDSSQELRSQASLASCKLAGTGGWCCVAAYECTMPAAYW